LDYLTTHISLSPIQRGFAPGFVNYKKGCIRLAAASNKVYQLLAHGRWFYPGTPASSITKTGRHDIVAILLKVALKIKIQILLQSSSYLRWVRFNMVFKTTLNNISVISWLSVLLVEETGVPGENYRPAVSH
jgi:hypothetical protein